MVKSKNAGKREQEILSLIIDSYIEETKPISSAYICKKYNLGYSSATIRNIMVVLERQGFLSHVYTSSGRVPTQEGFKCYVDNCQQDEVEIDDDSVNLLLLPEVSMEGVISHTLDVLTELSGYTSLVAISGRDEKIFFKGVRFMLEQPEFEDAKRLKDILYTLEVKMDALQSLLFDCIGERVKVLIGNDIGFDEISDCSLLVSGLRSQQLLFAFALLGPMRMNYTRAKSCLRSVKSRLQETIDNLLL